MCACPIVVGGMASRRVEGAVGHLKERLIAAVESNDIEATIETAFKMEDTLTPSVISWSQGTPFR